VEREISDAKLQIQLDVHTALAQLTAAREAIEAARKASQAAQASLDLAKVKFEVGVSNNIDVTSAQETVAIAEDNEVRSLFDLALARANLAKAQGDVLGFFK
jgi:outer membrane protein